MNYPDSIDASSVSLPISGRNKDSDKTIIVDYKDNEPKNDVEDKDNIEALQIEKNKDSNVENRTEETKEITPSELSDLTSIQSFENNDQSLSQESSYKKGPTPSLFSKMIKDEWELKLLDIILISLFILLLSNQDLSIWQLIKQMI